MQKTCPFNSDVGEWLGVEVSSAPRQRTSIKTPKQREHYRNTPPPNIRRFRLVIVKCHGCQNSHTKLLYGQSLKQDTNFCSSLFAEGLWMSPKENHIIQWGFFFKTDLHDFEYAICILFFVIHILLKIKIISLILITNTVWMTKPS